MREVVVFSKGLLLLVMFLTLVSRSCAAARYHNVLSQFDNNVTATLINVQGFPYATTGERTQFGS